MFNLQSSQQKELMLVYFGNIIGSWATTDAAQTNNCKKGAYRRIKKELARKITYTTLEHLSILWSNETIRVEKSSH